MRGKAKTLEHTELARKLMQDLPEDNEQSEANAKKKKMKENAAISEYFDCNIILVHV